MVITYHLETNDFWDVWEALVLKHYFDILLVFRKACSSKYFFFLVFVLNFGQLQSYASNTSNVKTISSYLALKRISESEKLKKDSCSTYEDLVEREEIICQKSRNPS